MVFLASYLIALYNKEEYIADCIESIIKEKSKKLDIEILIVDDGSSDGSLTIAEDFSKRFDFIKTFSFKKNKGKVSAFNLAFKKSQGDFIFLLGADDTLIRNRTQNMINQMVANSSSIYGGWKAFRKKHDDLNYNFIPKKISIYQTIMHSNIAGGTLGLIRSDAEIVFPIPSDLKFEDWWISTILIHKNRLKPYAQYVQNYRLTDSNDSFNLLKDANSIRSGFIRSGNYIETLERRINDNKLKYFFNRSKALRKCFFTRDLKLIRYLLPLDKDSFRFIGYILLGPNNFYNLNKFLKNIIFYNFFK